MITSGLCPEPMCVTAVYSIASAAALLFAARTALLLTRNRSLALAVTVMSMTALSASLALMAAVPAVVQDESGPAAWVSTGLGVLGTWGLAQILAMVTGCGCRFADMVTTPVLGGVSAAFLLLGLQRAGSLGAQEAAQSGLAVIGTQLSLVTYYGPGLCRIAALARRAASSARVPGVRMGLRVASASAGAGFALMLVRSAAAVVGACGLRVTWPAMTVIEALQGAAVIPGIAAVAAAPAVTLIASRCAMWVAYRRLHPLWAALLQAVPHVRLPAERGVVSGIRWRLLRRVIEIRDAELALRPYWRSDVAARASAAARSAALGVDLEQAAVEAAVVINAAGACIDGKPPSRDPVPAERVFTMAGEDLQSEVTRLIQVSRIIRRYPAVSELPARWRRNGYATVGDASPTGRPGPDLGRSDKCPREGLSA